MLIACLIGVTIALFFVFSRLDALHAAICELTQELRANRIETERALNATWAARDDLRKEIQTNATHLVEATNDLKQRRFDPAPLARPRNSP